MCESELQQSLLLSTVTYTFRVEGGAIFPPYSVVSLVESNVEGFNVCIYNFAWVLFNQDGFDCLLIWNSEQNKIFDVYVSILDYFQRMVSIVKWKLRCEKLLYTVK